MNLTRPGLLNPKLRAEWVTPVKQRLINMLNKGTAT